MLFDTHHARNIQTILNLQSASDLYAIPKKISIITYDFFNLNQILVDVLLTIIKFPLNKFIHMNNLRVYYSDFKRIFYSDTKQIKLMFLLSITILYIIVSKLIF